MTPVCLHRLRGLSNPILLIISLTIRVFYGFVAISDLRLRLLIISLTVICAGFLAVSDSRLLIISLTVVVCAGFVAVFDSRLLIISLIALNGVQWYGDDMRRLCCWGMTAKLRKILRGMVRLTNYGSVNIHV